jgi:hypothetical protein
MDNEYCQGTDNGNYGIQQNMICAGVPDFDGDGITDGGLDACQGLTHNLHKEMHFLIR